MSIKNDNLGGTDWSDGNILYAVDLNDTLNSISLKASNNLIDNVNESIHNNYKSATLTNYFYSGDFTKTSTNLTKIDCSNSDFNYYYCNNASIVFESEKIGLPFTANYGFINSDYFLAKMYGSSFDFTDTNYWTSTGSGTVSTNYIDGSTNSIYVDSNDLSGYDKIIIYFKHIANAATGYNAIGRVYLVDNSGSNSIINNTADGTFYAYVEIFNDGTDAVIFVNGIYDRTISYNTTLKIRYYASHSGGSNPNSKVYSYFVGLSGSPTSTVTTQITADSGSNWESGTPNGFHKFTNTGNGLGYKITSTIASDEVIVFKHGVNFGGIN